jgi:hypothetical protein
LELMISLCPGCHAKVERKMVLAEMTPLLLDLWREQHPEGHEQVMLPFDARGPAAQAVSSNVSGNPPDEAARLEGAGTRTPRRSERLIATEG